MPNSKKRKSSTGKNSKKDKTKPKSRDKSDQDCTQKALIPVQSSALAAGEGNSLTALPESHEDKPHGNVSHNCSKEGMIAVRSASGEAADVCNELEGLDNVQNRTCEVSGKSSKSSLKKRLKSWKRSKKKKKENDHNQPSAAIDNDSIERNSQIEIDKNLIIHSDANMGLPVVEAGRSEIGPEECKGGNVSVTSLLGESNFSADEPRHDQNVERKSWRFSKKKKKSIETKEIPVPERQGIKLKVAQQEVLELKGSNFSVDEPRHDQNVDNSNEAQETSRPLLSIKEENCEDDKNNLDGLDEIVKLKRDRPRKSWRFSKKKKKSIETKKIPVTERQGIKLEVAQQEVQDLKESTFSADKPCRDQNVDSSNEAEETSRSLLSNKEENGGDDKNNLDGLDEIVKLERDRPRKSWRFSKKKKDSVETDELPMSERQGIKLKAAQQEVKELKAIMENNLTKIIEREGKLEELEINAREMALQSEIFKLKATHVGEKYGRKWYQCYCCLKIRQRRQEKKLAKKQSRRMHDENVSESKN